MALAERMWINRRMSARTPADVDRLFGEYVNAGQLDALLDLYEPTASLVGLDGSVATGHAALRAALGAILASRPRLTMHVTRVVEDGSGIAILYNDWRGSFTGADGAVVERAGKALEIVRRQPDGTWRFVIDDPMARG